MTSTQRLLEREKEELPHRDPDTIAIKKSAIRTCPWAWWAAHDVFEVTMKLVTIKLRTTRQSATDAYGEDSASSTSSKKRLEKNEAAGRQK